MQSGRVISETVGRQVEVLRKARGFTQRQLVAACAEAGWKITLSTIENIEGAIRTRHGKPGLRREISVDELLGLAYVLGVHPVDLLVPGDAPDDELVPIPPGLEVPADVARAWIGGAGLLREPADFGELGELTRWMPERRRQSLARAWGAKEVEAMRRNPNWEAEEIYRHNLREDAVDPDRIGGLWGPDGYLRADGESFSTEQVDELVEQERARRAARKKAPEGDDAPGEQ